MRAVDIGEVVASPRDYDGGWITVAGEVTDSLNLLLVRAYTVRDRTGEILVVTERAVPRKGEHVRVRGQVNQAFAFGGKSLVVIMEAAK